MRSAWIADNRRIVRRLLIASQSRSATDSQSSLLLTAAIALLNLLLCVLFENPIKDDITGQTLALFFFVQGWAIFFLVLLHISSNADEILRHTLVMPVPRDDRLVFAFLSSVRNPIVIALAATEAFFMLVIHHSTIASIVVIPLLVGLNAASVALVASVAAVSCIRRGRPTTIISSYSILVLLFIAATSLMLHLPAIFGMVPPMALTARGIVAISSGQMGSGLILAGASAAFFVLLAFLGRRFA